MPKSSSPTTSTGNRSAACVRPSSVGLIKRPAPVVVKQRMQAGPDGMCTIGIAADHGGYDLKEGLVLQLLEAGIEVRDFGNGQLKQDDDFPDVVIPLAHALASGAVYRGIAICGSGVGASICANKVAGVRAALIHDTFSARQGVEDDDMNCLCLGGLVIGSALAWEVVTSFLVATFRDESRFRRRLAKVAALESTMR